MKLAARDNGGLKGTTSPSTEHLPEVFYPASSNDKTELHGNVTFAVGVLVDRIAADITPSTCTCSLLFHSSSHLPMYPLRSSELRARDNTPATVSHIIFETEAIQLDQVLAVIVVILPLKTDSLKTILMLRAFFLPFPRALSVIASYLDHFLLAFAHVFELSSLDHLKGVYGSALA